MRMNSEKDLKAALTEILENNGALPSLRAKLRSEIAKAVEEPACDAPPKLPEQNCLINELVLEYLAFNNYKRTASILEAESGYQQSRVGRAFLEKELRITLSKEASKLPLLYSILETLRSSEKHEPSTKSKKKKKPEALELDLMSPVHCSTES